MDLFYSWQGKKVRLRAPRLEDVEWFLRQDEDSHNQRANDRLYLPPSPLRSEAWLEKLIVDYRPDSHDVRLMIETLDGELVGTINPHDCDPQRGTWEYGIVIDAAHRRKGYATEAIILVGRYYFEELRYQKLNIHVYGFNASSIQLHERLGFTLEGRIRRMIYTNGQFWDELVYGMTAEEFHARYGSPPLKASQF